MKAILLVFTCVSKPTGASFCFHKLFYFLPLHTFMFCNNYLRYALPVVNGKIFFRKIDEQYFQLAPVIGINSAGRIKNCYAVL